MDFETNIGYIDIHTYVCMNTAITYLKLFDKFTLYPYTNREFDEMIGFTNFKSVIRKIDFHKVQNDVYMMEFIYFFNQSNAFNDNEDLLNKLFSRIGKYYILEI